MQTNKYDYRIYDSQEGQVAVDFSDLSIGNFNKAIAQLRTQFGVIPKCIAVGLEGNDIKKILSWNKEKGGWDTSLPEEDVPSHWLIAA